MKFFDLNILDPSPLLLPFRNIWLNLGIFFSKGKTKNKFSVKLHSTRAKCYEARRPKKSKVRVLLFLGVPFSKAFVVSITENAYHVDESTKITERLKLLIWKKSTIIHFMPLVCDFLRFKYQRHDMHYR